MDDNELVNVAWQVENTLPLLIDITRESSTLFAVSIESCLKSTLQSHRPDTWSLERWNYGWYRGELRASTRLWWRKLKSLEKICAEDISSLSHIRSYIQSFCGNNLSKQWRNFQDSDGVWFFIVVIVEAQNYVTIMSFHAHIVTINHRARSREPATRWHCIQPDWAAANMKRASSLALKWAHPCRRTETKFIH